MSRYQKTDFERARDEFMSQAMRCGVLRATPEHQDEWIADTMDYLLEQFPSLTPAELDELKQIGQRFCQPVIPHGDSHTAWTAHDTDTDDSEAETDPLQSR